MYDALNWESTGYGQDYYPPTKDIGPIKIHLEYEFEKSHFDVARIRFEPLL